MIVYLADTTENSMWGRIVRERQIPQMISRGRLQRHTPGLPWAFDNGAFMDYKQGKPFDTATYRENLRQIAHFADPPTFLVIPDIVGDGEASADFSSTWLLRLEGIAPRYWAAQDGQTPNIIPWDDIDGIFVGGTTKWKLTTGENWVRAAHDHGVQCHIGRVGTPGRVRWAYRIGADSIDSSQPLWSRIGWANFWGSVWSAENQLTIDLNP